MHTRRHRKIILIYVWIIIDVLLVGIKRENALSRMKSSDSQKKQAIKAEIEKLRRLKHLIEKNLNLEKAIGDIKPTGPPLRPIKSSRR